MPARKARPTRWMPKGLSDSVDGTQSFPGAMLALKNLIPNPSTDNTWVPRPAANKIADFTALFTAPGFISGLLVVGNTAYGMIATGRNAGHDEPFVYSLLTNTFLPVSGISFANTPASPAELGEWTPPILAVVGSKIVVTHPGFAGGATGMYFGWFDISGLVDTTHTGDTHSSTVIDNLSANVLQAGWSVGMGITGTGILGGTTIVGIATDGLSLTLSTATVLSNNGVALTVMGGTVAAPLWAAGNTNGNPLLAVPTSVVQMAGRAYFAVNAGATAGVVFSDSGNATQVTNATQVLLFNNGIAVTALGPLPLLSPITGGIVQAVIAFQSNVGMQIISGDATTQNLTVNVMKAGTGTLAPLSITPFTEGLAFISPEGLRIIDFNARVSNPIGDHGSGVSMPFIYAVFPSRICMTANADTLRVSVQNGFANGQPQEEFWLDITRKAWNGPHTFPASMIQAWGATFLVAPHGIDASLWQSDATPSSSSSYTENGTQLTWEFQTVLLPDSFDMKMHNLCETTLASNYPPQALVTAAVMDETGAVLDTQFMQGSGMAATIWGSFVWGAAPWLGGAGFFQQRRVAWHEPIVFKQGSIQFNGNSLTGLVLGNIYLTFQELGYLLESMA